MSHHTITTYVKNSCINIFWNFARVHKKFFALCTGANQGVHKKGLLLIRASYVILCSVVPYTVLRFLTDQKRIYYKFIQKKLYCIPEKEVFQLEF